MHKYCVNNSLRTTLVHEFHYVAFALIIIIIIIIIIHFIEIRWHITIGKIKITDGLVTSWQKFGNIS